MTNQNKSTRARTLAIALLAIAAAICAYFVSQQYELVTEQIDTGESLTARKNPYLAAEQFLNKVKITTHSSQLLDSSLGLPENTTLIITRSTLIPSDQRAGAILDWVALGGVLIVGAPDENDDGDHLLSKLNISVYNPNWEETQDYLSFYIAPNCKKCTVQPPPDIQWSKRWGWPAKKTDPNSAKAMRNRFEKRFDDRNNIRFANLVSDDFEVYLAFNDSNALWHSSFDVDEAEKPSSHWNEEQTFDYWTDADGDAKIMRLEYAKGIIYVLTDSDIWRNTAITHFDHAYFLKTLTQNRGEVHILFGSTAKSFWARLVEYFPEALGALFITLLLWLWANLVRVGPVSSAFTPNRRALSEHILAGSQYIWGSEEPERLIQSARAATLRKAQSKIPSFETYNQPQKIALLHAATGTDTDQLEAVFYASPQRLRPQEFVQFMQTIQQIRNAL